MVLGKRNYKMELFIKAILKMAKKMAMGKLVGKMEHGMKVNFKEINLMVTVNINGWMEGTTKEIG